MSTHKAETPLIPESLVRFYRRMARAWRSPAPPAAVAVAELSRVVELHHCMAATIRVAVQRSDPGGQEQLREQCSEQTRLAHAVADAGSLIHNTCMLVPRGTRCARNAISARTRRTPPGR